MWPDLDSNARSPTFPDELFFETFESDAQTEDPHSFVHLKLMTVDKNDGKLAVLGNAAIQLFECECHRNAIQKEINLEAVRTRGSSSYSKISDNLSTVSTILLPAELNDNDDLPERASALNNEMYRRLPVKFGAYQLRVFQSKPKWTTKHELYFDKESRVPGLTILMRVLPIQKEQKANGQVS